MHMTQSYAERTILALKEELDKVRAELEKVLQKNAQLREEIAEMEARHEVLLAEVRECF